jgi:hypothetical protein
MSRTPLTPAQQAEADRIYEAVRASLDTDTKQIAELLAAQPDGQLLGATEFTLRDLVIGARLKGSGRRWSEAGADAVCHLRALFKSEPGQWQAFGATAA